MDAFARAGHGQPDERRNVVRMPTVSKDVGLSPRIKIAPTA